jgi:hypothetical protein
VDREGSQTVKNRLGSPAPPAARETSTAAVESAQRLSNLSGYTMPRVVSPIPFESLPSEMHTTSCCEYAPCLSAVLPKPRMTPFTRKVSFFLVIFTRKLLQKLSNKDICCFINRKGRGVLVCLSDYTLSPKYLTNKRFTLLLAIQKKCLVTWLSRGGTVPSVLPQQCLYHLI